MKKTFLPLLAFFLVFLPGAAVHAANLPLLDPNFSIVPEACRAACPCGVGAALQFIQNIMNVLISFAVIVMSLIIVWAGFLFVMSAANPESRSKARGMLINAFIGLFIVLSAWLIVDFIMKHLYGDGSTAFGPWNKILVLSGDQCIVVDNNLGKINGLPGGLAEVGVNGVLLGTGASGGGASGIPVGTGNNCPAADPATMKSFPSSATLGGPEKATPTTVQNFLAMRAEALKAGIDLRVTDGYRSETEQVNLWNQRGSIGQVAKPCSVPGGTGSNHNSGVALDISIPGCGKSGSCNSKTYVWLKTNGGRYGFYNNLPGTDNVHWSPSGR